MVSDIHVCPIFLQFPLFLANIPRIASFIGKMESLRWTPHMEESLEILEREKEYVQDEILTSLIRMQLIADEAPKLLVQDIMRGDDAGHTPSFVYRKSMLNRLQTVRDSRTPTANASCTYSSIPRNVNDLRLTAADRRCSDPLLCHRNSHPLHGSIQNYYARGPAHRLPLLLPPCAPRVV